MLIESPEEFIKNNLGKSPEAQIDYWEGLEADVESDIPRDDEVTDEN